MRKFREIKRCYLNLSSVEIGGKSFLNYPKSIKISFNNFPLKNHNFIFRLHRFQPNNESFTLKSSTIQATRGRLPENNKLVCYLTQSRFGCFRNVIFSAISQNKPKDVFFLSVFVSSSMEKAKVQKKFLLLSQLRY